MPHQRPDSTSATSQNAATERQQPSDQAREDHASVRPEAKTYAAPDVRDSSLAAPAAGEVGDYADLAEPSGGMHQGANHTNRELHAGNRHQGPKTQAAQRNPTRRD
jgi:hypothetical protein